MVEETTIWPPYKAAAEAIAKRVRLEGYGFLIVHADIDDLLGIEPLPELITKERATSFSIERMTGIESLKEELLTEYKICLISKHTVGYGVATPDEQVSEAPKKCWKKVRNQFKKITSLLSNVNHDLLTDEGTASRNRELAKLAFVQSASRKRKHIIAEQQTQEN